MRYEKADALQKLAIRMQASRVGLTLNDIETEFGVGRRTAMRMRDAILRNYPQTREWEDDGRVKRWSIPSGTVDRLVTFTAEEIADLEATIALLKRENLRARAASLRNLEGKLRALMRPEQSRRMEPDLEALLEAEGLAMRPGPRPKLESGIIETLREAIKACRQVTLRYRARGAREAKKRLVHPYGFLLGHRHYLVAFHVHEKANKHTLFSLPGIEAAEISDKTFVRDSSFSLEEFAKRSFGVFQEKPFDVVWRFSPEAADTAREFLFHPNQKTEDLPDGSLIVRFSAGSDLEMAWHLYTWGDQVEVLEPKRLADMVNGSRRSWAGLP
jgi:predicted DNA-binding transcriptional regulator YafY